MKKIKNGMKVLSRKFLVVFLIFLAAVSFVITYQNQTQLKLKMDVTEHASILSRSLWNYDQDSIEAFVTAFAGRDDYREIRVINWDNTLFYETKKTPSSGVDAVLDQLGVVGTKVFVEDIKNNKQPIGRIEVVWRDTTIYAKATTFVVAVLMSVIVLLYGRIIETNKMLKKKIDDLRRAVEEVRIQKEYIEQIFDVVPQGLITFNDDRRAIQWNTSFTKIIEHWAKKLDRDIEEIRRIFLDRLQMELRQADEGEYTLYIDNHPLNMAFASSNVPGFKNICGVVSLRDVTELVTMQRRLTQAEKLESVGRLAAGIAHEINTPTQYVLTNLEFLADVYRDLADVMSHLAILLDTVDQSAADSSIYGEIRKSFREADWDFLAAEIPDALEQSREGLHRIQSIVGAMKQFSHPAGESAGECDLNSAIETTVTVARNEWKYVAEVVLDLDQALPRVPCFIDQFNQVILIMIVNSVHAIEEKLKKNGPFEGLITIKSRADTATAIISLTDNGIGMQEGTIKKIFDPFFTTKELNKGTGQGLAIAHDIITNKHKGSIAVVSEPEKGSTFEIRLPREVLTPPVVAGA